jgi:glycosyltransferase involved in cell wall biosynthesis
MQKLKILYTIPNFDTAGSGKVLYDLAKGLDKERFEVHIACSHNRGVFFNEVVQLGLPIHIIETTSNIRPYWSLYQRLQPYKQFIKQHQFDIVHSWHWSSDWTEVLAAKLGGATFVFTKKAMTWGNRHWKLRSYFSDFIITINEDMRTYFPNKKHQKLIPLGLDIQYYNPEHFPIKTPSETLRIITVANLVPVKGIEVLIDAVNLLDSPHIELTIIGDDRSDYAECLKQKVKALGKESSIKFLGKHMDVRPFLAQSDLYVIPTLNEGRKEGMPMALVEAMSMAVPVLGSNISGINFVLKEFPELLFPPANSMTLAEKIKRFQEATLYERQQLGNVLRNYVEQNFSLEQFVNAHEELYKSLVGGE